MKVSFGTFWEVYGTQIMNLPPEIKTKEEAVEYLRDNFEDIPLPTNGDYVLGSDELDEESVEIYED